MKLNKITAALALATVGASAFALDFSANIELDNTYRSGSKVKGTVDEGLTQSGRVELNASGKAGANMFVAGKAAFLAKKDGSVATDDMWVQMGTSAVDVKLGRFEAIDLFPLPGDTIVNNADDVYTTNLLRGRKAGSQFHAAITGNLGGGLSAELGLVETKEAAAAKGVRPAISYANGPLSLRVGVESGKFVGGNDFTGFGGSVAYDLGGFKITGNLASGKEEVVGGDIKANTFGLIGSFGPANLGLISGKTEQAGTPDTKVTTVYGSYTLPLFDIKGASITPAFSTSTAKTAGVSVKDNGVRVRINYTF